MRSVSVADAKARFSELVQAAEAGETVSITRRGRPVARLVAEVLPRKPVDLSEFERVAKEAPYQSQSAGDFLRELKDADLL